MQVLRKKIEDVEGENEKLNDENKKLQLRVTKRVPLSSSETSYLERQVSVAVGGEVCWRVERWASECFATVKEGE